MLKPVHNHKAVINRQIEEYYLASRGKAVAVGGANEDLLTNLPFILGLFSAFNFLTSYLIFLANNLVLLFSRYLETLASLPPSPFTPCPPI